MLWQRSLTEEVASLNRLARVNHLGTTPPPRDRRPTDRDRTVRFDPRAARWSMREDQRVNVESPLDLVRTYVVPSQHGVGRRLSLETIDRRLTELPLRPVLDLLTQVTYRADAAGSSADSQRELARQSLRSADYSRFVQLSRSNPGLLVFSSQMAVALAIRALVHCPDRDSDLGPDDVPDLVELVLGLAEHVGAAANVQDLMLEMVRLGLFFRLRDQDCWYEVAFRLLFEILPNLNSHARFVDVRALIEHYTGLDLDRFWAMTVSYGIAIAHEPTCTDSRSTSKARASQASRPNSGPASGRSDCPRPAQPRRTTCGTHRAGRFAPSSTGRCWTSAMADAWPFARNSWRTRRRRWAFTTSSSASCARPAETHKLGRPSGVRRSSSSDGP